MRCRRALPFGTILINGRLSLRQILAGLLVMIAGPTWADDYWQYGSWGVFLEEQDTGQDLWRICSAVSGFDGGPTVMISVSNGDAGPPDFFPTVLIFEQAIRKFNTSLRGGQAAYINFNDGNLWNGEVDHYVSDEGLARADIAFDHPLSQSVLRAMRKNSDFDVVVEGKRFMTVNLAGFSAAYLKMLDECGFS